MERLQNLTPIFSVSDFLASINQTLEYAYPSVEVEGEVMSFKVSQGKYVFFDLKDSGGSINCFMTVWQLRVPIADGMKVVVRATAKVTQWGKFSLTVQAVRPSGEGSLKKSYELLKEKLEKDGLFAVERKRPLPVLPQHIAVISSTQSAGYADFIKLINERWGGLLIEVAHTQVQGEGAPDQMIRAIKHFNEQANLPEVLVIIRGGGSADDLSCFNDELLVREIAASRIPTVVGVGHEIDETLADYVADVRAVTPSNAAQIVVPDKREIKVQISSLLERIIARINSGLAESKIFVDNKLYGMFERIEQQHQALSDRLLNAVSLLEAYSPLAVIGRGYAIVRGVVKVGSEIKISTKNSIITAEVKHVRSTTE